MTDETGGARAGGEEPARGKARRRRVLRAVALVLVLSGGASVAVFGPRLRERQRRDLITEAGKQLYTLCTNVTALHDETGHWTAAGPQPAAVPRGEAVPFPKDPAFEQLQFQPGPGHYQYQVIVDGNPDGEAKVRCVARGDLDGDGQPSEATLEIDENGMMRPVTWRDESE
jgi:hypothetical protein